MPDTVNVFDKPYDLESIRASLEAAAFEAASLEKAETKDGYTVSKFPDWTYDIEPYYERLRCTAVSLYSSLLPHLMPSTEKALKAGFEFAGIDRYKVKIIDANANVGCDSFFFELYSPGAHIALELCPDTYALLCLNIKAMDSEVTAVNCNCVDYLRKEGAVRGAVVYFDPPWGGPDYHLQKRLPLHLCNDAGERVPIQNIVVRALDDGAAAVVVKVPTNFDYAPFAAFVGQVAQLRTYYITKGRGRAKAAVYRLIFIARRLAAA